LSVGNADILSDVIAILISIPTLTIIVHILKDILRVEKQVRDMTTPQLLKDAMETSFIYMENRGRTDKKSIEALERLYIRRQCAAEELLKRDPRATDLLRMWDKANQVEKGAIYQELRNKYGEEPLLSLRAEWVIPPMKA